MTTRTITNRKGQTFTVLLDDADAPLYDARIWYVSAKGYVVHSLPDKSKLWLHRVLMNAPADKQVDHINRNRLNNCRDNLRLCTSSENNRNRTRSSLNTSGYVGVSFDKDAGKWYAELTIHGRDIYLGLYDTAKEGAIARDAAALEYHGEFANLNISELVLAS